GVSWTTQRLRDRPPTLPEPPLWHLAPRAIPGYQASRSVGSPPKSIRSQGALGSCLTRLPRTMRPQAASGLQPEDACVARRRARARSNSDVAQALSQDADE